LKYRNNLSDESKNTFFHVKKPFEVLVLVGHSESNTWTGRSQMLGNVWKRVMLQESDQIHDLAGGVFAVINGEPSRVTMYVSDKHPFEKRYSTPIEEWPVENLEKIQHDYLIRPPKGGYNREIPMAPPGEFIGRSIDSVVNP
jgi:hypothetical protein